jgi:alpha-glucosidase
MSNAPVDARMAGGFSGAASGFRYRRWTAARKCTLLSLMVTGGFLFLARADDRVLVSPDKRIRVAIELPAPGTTNRPVWSAWFQEKPILTGCRLGIRTMDGGELLSGVKIVKERKRSVDHSIPVLFGKADHAADVFHESRFTFESPEHRRLDVIFRCYNDAVAFRYELPKDGSATTVSVTDETTSFQLQGDPTAYAQYLESYTTSHEHNVTTVNYSGLATGRLMDLPLTFSWSDDTSVAITEAALRHYAGMSLMRSNAENSGTELACRLTPRPDGIKVIRPLPMETPWRVALIGKHPGDLLESSTLYCLNDPSVIKDTSWIRPGKITFSWWNGDVYDGKRGLPILSTAMAGKYIDFCASNGIPTHSITSKEGNPIFPWYYQSKPGVAPGPDTDVTRPRDDFDLPTIRSYAESKHVRLWTWVHQAALRGRVAEAFAAFEKMGWSGMIVDFFDHDDQESVEFAESILEAAARHHIMIHLHGVWKPSGWQRTYPNLMNHEGSLNLEYLKWSHRCTPEHDLLMAFTRLIAGPMDYHLGGFRAVTDAEFKPHSIAPNVLGTRCHQLAMYVCFDNPNPMVADYPMAYAGQPGFEFVQLVPTWWDETKVLAGKPGEVLVTARRKGGVWYVGGMSARQSRDLSLPLGFLGRGEYRGKIWQDAADSEIEPNHLATETWTCSSKDQLKIHFALNGGYVAQFIPVEK